MENNVDTSTILASLARHALTTFAGGLAAHGYIMSSDTEQFVGAALVGAGLVWSWWQKEGQADIAAAFDHLKDRVHAIPKVTIGTATAEVQKVNSAIEIAKVAASEPITPKP